MLLRSAGGSGIGSLWAEMGTVGGSPSTQSITSWGCCRSSVDPPASSQPTLLDFLPRDGGSPGAPTSPETPRTGLGDTGWQEAARSYYERLRADGLIGAEWARRIHWHIVRTPALLRRVGFDPPPPPMKLGLEHLEALQERLGWSRNGLAVYFAALRGLLRTLSHPLAEARGAWRLPSGDATRRRWIRPEQLSTLLAKAEGMEKVVVVLEGFNAFRRIEVQRLRVRDLDLAHSRVRVCGKGRGGGKWRTIPLTTTAARVLEPVVRGKSPDTLVVGRSASGLDLLLARAAKRAGLAAQVSNHDLRRTFGRVAYHSGMGLVDLKNFMGHASVDMTAHYIGLDEDHMREGVAHFDERMGVFAGPARETGRAPGAGSG